MTKPDVHIEKTITKTKSLSKKLNEKKLTYTSLEKTLDLTSVDWFKSRQKQAK